MGDRANLAIIDGRDQHGDPCAIYIHTHWAGTRLPHNLAEYLAEHEGNVEPSAIYEYLQSREVRPELATAYFDLEASHPVVWAIDLLDRKVYEARVQGLGDSRLSRAELEAAHSCTIPEFVAHHAITPEQVTEWTHLPGDCVAGNLYAAAEENVKALAGRPDMARVRETIRLHEQFEQKQAAREAEAAAPTLAPAQDLSLSR